MDAAYRDQVQEASTRISKLIESHASLAPLFLKLSFHGENLMCYVCLGSS